MGRLDKTSGERPRPAFNVYSLRGQVEQVKLMARADLCNSVSDWIRRLVEREWRLRDPRTGEVLLDHQAEIHNQLEEALARVRAMELSLQRPSANSQRPAAPGGGG